MTPQALAAALFLGAGMVHAAAAGTHTGDDALVRLFAATALVQVAIGVLLLVRPSRRLLLVAATSGLAAFGAWVLSRTTGLPVIDSLAAKEGVGLQDATAAFLALAGATVAFVGAGLPSAASFLGRPALALVAVVPAALGLVAPHQHDAGHAHVHAGDAAVADGADPLFAGADTSTVTPAQLAAARALVIGTREAVTSAFTDEASVVAAGYRSIGDGRRLQQPYEHFVNISYMADGHVLDPARPESLVLERVGNAKRVASAMYILEPGSTMADVPEVAGALTTWHDHQNLCWDASGTRLAGVQVDGRCVPGGTFRPTPPMLHVWMTDNPCGPFAGIEGSHGTGCTHTH